MGHRYLSVFVWVVGSFLAVSRLKVLIGINVLEIFVILFIVESLDGSSMVGQERA